MSIRSRRARLLLALALASLACGKGAGEGGGPAAPAEAETSPAPPRGGQPLAVLAAGAVEQRSLAEGAVHAFALDLAAGSCLTLGAEQLEIDLALDLYGPEGGRLLRMDNPTGASGREHLCFCAQEPGRYRLEVVAFPGQPPGRYRLEVVALGPGTEEDHLRARGTLLLVGGDEHRRRGDRAGWEEALPLYQAALVPFEALRDLATQADLQERLARTLADLDRPRESAQARRRALDLFRRLGDRPRQARTASELGSSLLTLGRPEEAQEALEEALDLFHRLEDLAGEAEVLDRLGGLSKNRGSWRLAERLYEEASARWQQLGDRRNEAITLYNQGRLYDAAGEEELALDAYDRAAALLPADASPEDRSVILQGRAAVLWDLGRHDEALADLQQALELRRQAQDRLGEAYALGGMAQFYYLLEDYERARAAYEEALGLLQEVENPWGEAIILQNLAWLHLKQGAAEEALALFRRALPMVRETEDRLSEAATLLGMARALRQRGDLEAAWARASEALEVVETVREGTDRLDLRSSFFADKQDYFDLAVDLLLALDQQQPEAGYAAQAFAVSERSRARRLLDALPASWTEERRYQPGERRHLAALKAQVDDAEERRMMLLAAGAGEEELAAAKAELRRALADLRRLQGRLEGSPAGSGDAGFAPVLSLAQVQTELLDEETLLLQFDLGEERSTLWAISRREARVFRLPPAVEIETLALETARLMAESGHRLASDRPRQAAQLLSEKLLAPVAHLLTRRRLLIVPDGALHYLPFGALPRPGAPGEPAEPLLARHEVLYAPSSSVAAWLRRRVPDRPPAPKRLAVVADPVFSAGDPRLGQAGAGNPARAPEALERLPEPFGTEPPGRLRHAGREARAILALVPPEERLEALGFDANRELVLRGGLDGYRMVHFATHALVDTEHPELSGLVLSLVDRRGEPRKGYLRLHEIFDLHLTADLVVLSACRTALGRRVRGEGLVGLAHGFFQAGAGEVVVSLWPVNDEAAAELMAHFYEGMLERGLAPAAALREAQLRLRREPRWSAPYYWAGFVLQGYTKPVEGGFPR